jgi:hypothetical protein
MPRKSHGLPSPWQDKHMACSAHEQKYRTAIPAHESPDDGCTSPLLAWSGFLEGVTREPPGWSLLEWSDRRVQLEGVPLSGHLYGSTGGGCMEVVPWWGPWRGFAEGGPWRCSPAASPREVHRWSPEGSRDARTLERGPWRSPGGLQDGSPRVSPLDWVPWSGYRV